MRMRPRAGDCAVPPYDYLESCRKLGREPNHPYSGQFRLRLQPELHARAALIAQTQGKSLNTWVSEVIARSLGTS
jgi:predicted HicB family RNase H-like nuclease